MGSSELKELEKIRGMSDSASLIRKYHDFDLHKNYPLQSMNIKKYLMN